MWPGIDRAAGKLLMDCLQSSPRNERRSWFDSMGDMRRSADTTSWRAVPSLLSLFSLDDASQLDRMSFLRRAVCDRMAVEGLAVTDIDRNADGSIQLDELIAFVDRLLDGQPAGPTRLELEALVRDADVSNDGLLQYDEFTAYFYTVADEELAYVPVDGEPQPEPEPGREAQYENEPLMVAAKEQEEGARAAEAAERFADASIFYRQAAKHVQDLQSSLGEDPGGQLAQMARRYYELSGQAAAAMAQHQQPAPAPAPSPAPVPSPAPAGDVPPGASLAELSREQLEGRCMRLEAQVAELRRQLATGAAPAQPDLGPEPEPEPALAPQPQPAPEPAPGPALDRSRNHVAIADLQSKLENRRATFAMISTMDGIEQGQLTDMRSDIARMEQELTRLMGSAAALRP